MEIKIVTEAISLGELTQLAHAWYDDMVKGVVDVEREVLALGGEYHMDANMCLTESGSKQEAVWGFNIYPNRPRSEWIEFFSLINIRPASHNRSMLIESKELQEKMRAIINNRIK